MCGSLLAIAGFVSLSFARLMELLVRELRAQAYAVKEQHPSQGNC